MPKGDATSPATKQYIALLMEEIRRLYQATEGWKEEILDACERWQKELKLHFDVVIESLRGDIKAISEPLQNHERRITRLACPPKPWRRWEEHAGIPA